MVGFEKSPLHKEIAESTWLRTETAVLEHYWANNKDISVEVKTTQCMLAVSLGMCAK
jgi:hypothetical protein